MTRKITRDELVDLLAAGEPVQFVETLRAEHFAQGHLPGAIHIHFEAIDEHAPELLPDKDAAIVTYCSNLACRNSDIAAHKDKLGSEFLSGYVSVLADARPFPVVLGGQEFSESLLQTLEALQYGQVSAKDAQANAQADATSILERAAK